MSGPGDGGSSPSLTLGRLVPMRHKFINAIEYLKEIERRKEYENAMKYFWQSFEVVGECWEWQGRLDRSGYGYFGRAGRDTRAHRVAWIDLHGEIPAGLHVLHTCDNPCCIRPDHLMIGDHTENMRHKAIRHRGHYQRGESSARAILNWEQVREIRRRYTHESISQVQLSREYGVGVSAISSIIRNVTWQE